MADRYCEACVTLQDDAPDFVQNGVTSAIDTRLRNDRGFAAKSSVDTDCEALNLANDCLVGFMEDETEAYDTCEWKTWSARFAGNVHKVIDATISAVCGLWTKVHNLLSRVSALEDAQSNVCDVLGGITNLIVSEPQRHTMQTMSNIFGYREEAPAGTFYMMAEKKSVSICGETVRLQGISAVYDGPELYFKTKPTAGMILARISRNSIVPTYMSDTDWTLLWNKGEDFYQLYGNNDTQDISNGGSIIQTRLSGDRTVGEDYMVVRIRTVICGDKIVVGSSSSATPHPTWFNRSTPPVKWTEAN